MNTLLQVNIRDILLNGMNYYKPKTTSVWVYIRNMCGVGSNTAKILAQEFGWNPDSQIKYILAQSNN